MIHGGLPETRDGAIDNVPLVEVVRVLRDSEKTVETVYGNKRRSIVPMNEAVYEALLEAKELAQPLPLSMLSRCSPDGFGNTQTFQPVQTYQGFAQAESDQLENRRVYLSMRWLYDDWSV